jgi:hypothetical protein
MKPSRQLYATLNKQAWVPQDLKNKMLNQPMNHWMIDPTLKPWDVYDSWKKNIPIIDEETKFLKFFAIIFGSLNVMIWIRVKIEKIYSF